MLSFRSSIGDTKNRSAELEMAHTNKISDNNAELPNNPIFATYERNGVQFWSGKATWFTADGFKKEKN